MRSNWTETRFAWLVLGMVFGGLLSVYWPQEPAMAAYTASGGEKFSMCAGTTKGGTSDAVFVLDQTTGRLVGGIYNNAQFSAMYIRNLAQDFGVADGAVYNMVPASVAPRIPGNAPTAEAGIFVGEQKSGKVIMYAFQTAVGTNQIVPLAQFPFRGQ
ncbi:MAG: hypothetical protein ACK5Q5_05290 [Planctomycetaceae bacterium]